MGLLMWLELGASASLQPSTNRWCLQPVVSTQRLGGWSRSQGILGRRRKSLPDSSRGKQLRRELYWSQSGCHVWRSIFVGREGVLGTLLASAVPSRLSVEEMKGVEIKYSARSRSVE